MKTLIVYHRGGGKSLNYPPNCILTIKWAIKNKAEAIEFDVVVAKDKIWKMVVIEPKLLSENNLNINNLKWNDLSNLNAGNQKHGQCKVAALKNVLDIVDQSKIRLQIHIKGDNPYTVPTLLSELKNLNNIVIASFDLKVLQEVKKITPTAKVGWIVKPDNESGTEGAADLTKIVTSNPGKLFQYAKEELRRIKDKAKSSSIDVIILCAPKIKSKEDIFYLQKEGFEVGAWGVGTNLAIAKKLIVFGINRFTIDNPEELKI